MLWKTICQLVLLFFTFSCLGWLMEVALKFIQYRRFINRGFLIGPYCPIYGWGVVAVTVLVGGMIGREGTVIEIFWAGVVLCGALEYFTSWYMETLFHARWWDYSQKPMNLHGRIWIGNLLLFGAASVVIVCWIDPVFFSLVEKLSPFWLRFLAAAVALILISDYAASHVLMNLVRREIDTQEGDNTEEISSRVRALLRDRNLLLRRIEQAYPDLRTQPRWLTAQLRRARREYRAANRRVADILREIRAKKEALHESAALQDKLNAALETLNGAKSKLHELQSKLRRRHDEF